MLTHYYQSAEARVALQSTVRGGHTVPEEFVAGLVEADEVARLAATTRPS
jgi:hypothetical protein